MRILRVGEEGEEVGRRLLQFPPLPEVPEPLRGNSFAVVEAVFLGDQAEGEALLEPLRKLGPALDTFAMQPPAGIAELHMDPRDPVPSLGDHNLVGELDARAIEELVAAAGPGSESSLVSVELRQGDAVRQRTVSNPAGEWRFEKVPAGAYGIRCQLQGFVTTEHRISLSEATTPLRVVLKVGALTETVVVDSASSRVAGIPALIRLPRLADIHDAEAVALGVGHPGTVGRRGDDGQRVVVVSAVTFDQVDRGRRRDAGRRGHRRNSNVQHFTPPPPSSSSERSTPMGV